MALVSLLPLFNLSKEKRKERIFIGHGAFNVNSAAHARGAFRAAEELRAPLIVQASQGACGFMSGRTDFRNATIEEKRQGALRIANVVRTMAERYHIPAVLHLDHAENYESTVAAMNAGFTSVMIDASAYPLSENIRCTRQVVEEAHPRGITVEGELGSLAGMEEYIYHEESRYTNPEEAVRFVDATNVDGLAISYGTGHGEFQKDVALDLSIPERVYAKLEKGGYPCELVSHGSSSIPLDLVGELEAAIERAGYGRSFKRPDEKVPVSMLQKAIKVGVSKINVDADLRLKITTNIWNYFLEHKAAQTDPLTAEVWNLMTSEPSRYRPRYYCAPLIKNLVNDTDGGNLHIGALMRCIENGVYAIVKQRIHDFGAENSCRKLTAL